MKQVLVLMVGILIVCADFHARAEADPLRIADGCVMEPPPGSPNAVAFMSITNSTDRALTITSVATPVAKKAELHKTVRTGGLTEMRYVKTLTLAPLETIRLSHQGYHLMLIGLKKRLDEDDRVRLVFELEGGSTVSIDVNVCRMKRH